MSDINAVYALMASKDQDEDEKENQADMLRRSD